MQLGWLQIDWAFLEFHSPPAPQIFDKSTQLWYYFKWAFYWAPFLQFRNWAPDLIASPPIHIQHPHSQIEHQIPWAGSNIWNFLQFNYRQTDSGQPRLCLPPPGHVVCSPAGDTAGATLTPPATHPAQDPAGEAGGGEGGPGAVLRLQDAVLAGHGRAAAADAVQALAASSRLSSE